MHQARFRKESLPPPETFYRREFPRLSRTSRGWAQTLCPFHKEHTPSLSLNLETGGFYCHGCQARGGDLIDFIRLRDGLSFKQAALALGAWDGSPQSAKAKAELVAKRREYERLRRAAEALDDEERRLRIETRSELHNCEQIVRVVRERLSSAPESDECCWAVMSIAHDEARTLAAAYTLLSFGTTDLRVHFVLNREERAKMAAEVLAVGFVRDDSGHVTEVLC
jgi:hypothetical protein